MQAALRVGSVRLWLIAAALLLGRGWMDLVGAYAGEQRHAAHPMVFAETAAKRPDAFRGALRVARRTPGPARGRSTPPLVHSVHDLDNGVIRLRLNDHAPIATQMWVSGDIAVPHDNVGADFQMTARGDKGDGYNPTQGGDCSGARSLLNSATPGWNVVTGDATARHGLMLGIQPRNYNEPAYPGCLGPGELLPYDMRFGVTLGDGDTMPRELMLVDMGIQRHSNSTAEPIVKSLSELPVLYLDNTRYRYAYFSVDHEPVDGLRFEPMRAHATHDTRAWERLTNHFVPEPARAIMLCDRGGALETPDVGRCVALYAHYGVTVQASHRRGALPDLTLITTIPIDSAEPRITDHALHTERRLVAVGSPRTVSAAIAWGAANMRPDAWARW